MKGGVCMCVTGGCGGSAVVLQEESVCGDVRVMLGFFFQAEDGIRDLVRSRGLGDVYKRQVKQYL